MRPPPRPAERSPCSGSRFSSPPRSLLGLLAFAPPAPHGLDIGIVQAADTQTLQSELPDGITLVDAATAPDARAAVASGDLAAAIDGNQLLVSSAASATRADYLTAVFTTARPGLELIDVQPLAAGDVSGVGLFFYALPNLLVGLITSIVLLQFEAWRMRAKLATIALTGAFSSVFTFAFATSLDVIPPDFALLGYVFLLTQAIEWLTTVAALHVKHFFMPIAMTFVLLLGIPTSGATVSSDMLPTWLAAIGDWHPFAQFIILTRADAYLGSDAIRPILVLTGRAVLGATLLWFHVRATHRTQTRNQDSAQAASALVPTDSPSPFSLYNSET
ncbi:hypothetical protein ATY41_12150 [Leifsonia xyli subsp. xyli]|uniref:Integral membrane protein n=2 Tax=Leifsonia xyli subsp. xyli TaxID=59736 RepID=Q6AFL8_LEIXX|nr:hypothetical protein [Leifsonia xyli]AAT88827.1 integral membrane protein [Leifsonia xyli subsp. xyli str. CTCB07]ODA89849.1 hypothetical protein ATY41_12150 [Leifsonia xyli subsp. xyli]